MVIYNGGKDAGASLNHKHMQVVPRSGHSGLESLLQDPEDGAQGPHLSRVQCEVVRTDLRTAMPDLGNVPFCLSAGALPLKPDGESLQQLFTSLRKKLELKPEQPYNMVLYHHSMVVIPRRTANIDGIDANAAGMTGDVWCSSEAQYEEWQRIGPMELLQQFGVPSDR